MLYYMLLVPPLAVAYAWKPAVGWIMGLATLALFLAIGAVEAYYENYTGLVDFAGHFSSTSK